MPAQTDLHKGLDVEEAPPIDMVAFRNEMREQDLEDLVDELVAAFLQDAPARFDALKTAIENADPAHIKSAAHAYKSAAVTMRAAQLSDLLQEAEHASRAGDVSRAVELLPQIESEHKAVLTHLR